MRRLAGLIVALLVPAAGGWGQVARGAEPAGPADPMALAEGLFQEGRQLLERGDAQRA